MKLLKELLLESASPILYHFTSLENAAKIVELGYFKLSNNMGNPAEEALMIDGYPFFLSTSRSKVSEYRGNKGVPEHGVMFVMDGNRLNSNNNLKVKPIDYWQTKTGKRGIDEMEDRVYSKKSTLDIKSITECHILVDNSDEEALQSEKKYIEEILKSGIPVYLYDDKKSFQVLNKKKVLPLDSFIVSGGSKKSGRFSDAPNKEQIKMVSDVIEMINAKTKDDLPDHTDDYFWSLATAEWRITSAGKELGLIISGNSGGDQPLYDSVLVISTYMIKHKIKDTKELIKNLIDKRNQLHNP